MSARDELSMELRAGAEHLPEELEMQILPRQPARRGEMEFQSVRPLSEADLPALLSPLPSAIAVQSTPSLSSLRHAHHQCARLIAIGRPIHEVSLMVGYSAGYISSLKSDPTFAELIKFYSAKTDEIFVDVAKRMKEMGLSVLEELQERLAREPEKWTKGEMMQFVELMFGKGGAAKASGLSPSSSNSGGVNIQVNFVKAQEQVVPMLDITPEA